MGIKNVRTATYVADTGKEFQLADMSSSHILNVIAHHSKQLEVLVNCPGLGSLPFMVQREQDMRNTIAELYTELAKRDPSKDEEIAPKRFNRDDY